MRLIDADELIHDLEYDVELCARALDDMNMIGKEREDMQFQKDCKQNCIWYISDQPTVDAVPIRHGKFIGTEYDGYADGNPVYYEWECSECGCIFEDDEPTYNYCPNCGADMRGKQNG